MMNRTRRSKKDALIDASSAILLYKAELLRIACAAYRLMMTPSVYSETTVPEQPGAKTMRTLIQKEDGITLLSDPMDVCPTHKTTGMDRLHRGERDTLLHYLNGNARFVIIDDGKGVQVCRRLQIPHVNALLFPFLLYYFGFLSKKEAEHNFKRIQRMGRYSTEVIQWAAHCTRTELGYFLDDD
jgi:hypothetical protein